MRLAFFLPLLFCTWFALHQRASALRIDDPVVFNWVRNHTDKTRLVLQSTPPPPSSSSSLWKRQAPILSNGTFAGYIRIGQLAELQGPSQTYSTLQMNAWRLWMARNPFFVINGTAYGIQLIIYADGSFPPDPPTTVIALTEWLITQDKVHILSTGMQGDNYGMEDTADSVGVPCINSGDYAASFHPPRPWTLYLLPKLQGVGLPCLQATMNAGAKKFVALHDPTGFLQLIYLPTLQALGGELVAEFNTTPAMLNDLTGASYDPIIQTMSGLTFDVLVGATSENVQPIETMLAFVRRMHQHQVNPTVISYAIGSYPAYRQEGTWQVAGHMIAEAYQPALNQPDPVWGSSLQYNAEFEAMFGIPTSNNDAALAGAITMLVVGLNNSAVDLASPASILKALNSVNTSSIFGPLYFVNNTVQRTIYCFQNTYPNASDVNVVWPPSSSAYTAIQYPAKADCSGSHEANCSLPSTAPDNTLQYAMMGTFIPLAVIVLIIVVVLLILRHKFHWIFISKKETEGNEDWTSSP